MEAESGRSMLKGGSVEVSIEDLLETGKRYGQIKQGLRLLQQVRK